MLKNAVSEFGGRSRTRTYDPLIKSQLLYHLSYAPAFVKAIWPRVCRANGWGL
jgi:hypothetical protein